MCTSRFAAMVCGAVVMMVGVVGALPRAQLGLASWPAVAGAGQGPVGGPVYTPEVQQARNNFQSAYNYLSQLANLAPDGPVAPPPPPPPPPPAPTSIYPLGYQFGGLTPEVAQATASFFQQYVAAAHAAAAQPEQPGASRTFPWGP